MSRGERVVRQTHARTCGAAALATLLREVLGQPADEAGILRKLGTRKAVDMDRLRRCAAGLGLRAHGYALDTATLGRVGRPGILHLQGSRELGHYVVLRGVDAENIRLADPARGDRHVSRDAFEVLWTAGRGEGRVLYVDQADSDWLPLKGPEDLPGRRAESSPLDWFPPP
ncbi:MULTISPECIES: C39 family peptidase [unclassified Thioalkalivibrio]|uniref:C39 family peptidase n=1 Tax=unclassified Thioalkalivibrio TaxID=2621013 RepID=UPI00037AEE8F|nr:MULTISPECIES: cysteine peptidase family C39 domain-containing protein [unclassified Thioalkalivibrio]